MFPLSLYEAKSRRTFLKFYTFLSFSKGGNEKDFLRRKNAYNVQNQQNAEIVKAKEEADKKAAEEAEAARKAAEETAKADAKVEAGTNEMIEYMKKACAECKADKKKTQAECLYTCSYQ